MWKRHPCQGGITLLAWVKIGTAHLLEFFSENANCRPGVLYKKGLLKQKRTLSIYFLAGSFSVSTEFKYFIDIHETQRKLKHFFLACSFLQRLVEFRLPAFLGFLSRLKRDMHIIVQLVGIKASSCI